MIFTDFKGERLPLLGFGAMRLPTVECNGVTVVDVELTEKMVDRAMADGVNYFDTAYPYHAGESEIIIGKVLSKYPRESYYLADKFPGHQLRESYDPAAVFEDQLKKCGVDYFDFYLLHNVNEKSVETYTDPKWGIIDYFLEQKKQGRIRHLGFSTHAMLPCLKDFLARYGDVMEFCQIQFNYLDEKLQAAGEKYELLKSYGIPVWVMEPVRGGRLAKLPDWAEQALSPYSEGRSIASFAFRWFFGLDGVKMILSGMSDMAQVEDNLRTFNEAKALSKDERELLADMAERMMSLVPCTGCGYCLEGCPAKLDIPMLIATYNEMKYAPTVNAAMRVEFIDDEKHPDNCVGCGGCTGICPQNIDVPRYLSELCEMVKSAPSWAKICREREEAEKRMKGTAESR